VAVAWPSSSLRTSRVIGADSVLAGLDETHPLRILSAPAGLLISVIAGSRGSEFDPKIDFVGLLKIMCRPSMSR
jgi:hypothetical protein